MRETIVSKIKQAFLLSDEYKKKAELITKEDEEIEIRKIYEKFGEEENGR